MQIISFQHPSHIRSRGTSHRKILNQFDKPSFPGGVDGQTGLFMAAPGQGREARHGGTAGLKQVGHN